MVTVFRLTGYAYFGCLVTLLSMREMSVAEQRYEAVRAVIADSETVTEVAARFGVSRKTMHVWLSRYGDSGLEGLTDRSHRSRTGLYQMLAEVEGAGA